MKYVMFTHTKLGIRIPVIVSDYMSHDEVKMDSPAWVATSAGFVNLVKPKSSRDICFGESKSLQLKVAKDDGAIVVSELTGTAQSTRYFIQDIEKNLAALKKIQAQKHAGSESLAKKLHEA